MGIDPAVPDHVADAVDQQIEEAGEQVEKTISAVQETADSLPPGERAAIADKLEGPTEKLEEAVEKVEAVIATNGDPEVPLDDLSRAKERFEKAVTDASTTEDGERQR